MKGPLREALLFCVRFPIKAQEKEDENGPASQKKPGIAEGSRPVNKIAEKRGANKTSHKTIEIPYSCRESDGFLTHRLP